MRWLDLGAYVPGDGGQLDGDGAPAACRGRVASETSAGRGGDGEPRQREQRRGDAAAERWLAPVHAVLLIEGLEAYETLRGRSMDGSKSKQVQAVSPLHNSDSKSRDEAMRGKADGVCSLPWTSWSRRPAALTNTTRFCILQCHTALPLQQRMDWKDNRRPAKYLLS